MSLLATAAAVFVYESLAKLASAYPARRVGGTVAANAWLHVSIVAGIGLSLLCVALEPMRRALGLSALEPPAFVPLLGALILTVLSGEAVAHVLRRDGATAQSLRRRSAPAH